MKRIHLTQGQVALVDDVDFEALAHVPWFAMWMPRAQCYYAARNVKLPNGKTRVLLMHRFLCNAAANQLVDHHDHDTLNNQRLNLRLCSRQQNSHNSVLGRRSASGFKGVTYSRGLGKWRAAIRRPEYTSLGFFVTPQEAAMAYDAAALLYFGEFALTNQAMGLLNR